MLAATAFDMSVGIHLHLVTAPPPSPPVPIPTVIPSVDLIMDFASVAVGAAISMAATGGPGLVFINGVPAANTAMTATNLFTAPHTPAPGIAFVKLPGPSNDSRLGFGSLNATIAGSLGVRMGDFTLGCSDPIRMMNGFIISLFSGCRRGDSTMKYKNGIEVMEGDVVAIDHAGGPIEGVVQKVILPNTPDAHAWAAPNGGVLIEGGGLGLSVTESLENDEDVVFVRRANSAS